MFIYRKLDFKRLINLYNFLRDVKYKMMTFK